MTSTGIHPTDPTSVGDPTSAGGAPRAGSTPTAREVVVRYVEAVRDGDTAVIRASFAEDATWHYPGSLPISGVWTGRDRIIDDFLAGIGTRLVPGSLVIELGGVVAQDDRVVAAWNSRGTTTDGAIYDNRCLGLFTVRDGKITSVEEYTDTHHVARVLFPGEQL